MRAAPIAFIPTTPRTPTLRERITIAPFETNAPPLVDSNAVLSFAITFERFEPVRGWNHQIAQIAGTIQILKLLARPLLHMAVDSPYKKPAEDSLGGAVLEGPYHNY